MSAPAVLVFAGDLVQQGDLARGERLLAACDALWPGVSARLLAGHCDPALEAWSGLDADPGGLRQDALRVLQGLRAQRLRQPALNLVFSANDDFSMHVARLFCAETDVAWTGRVFGPAPRGVACVDADGRRFEAALAAGAVLLVDERYFVRRAPAPSELLPPHGDARAPHGFIDQSVQDANAALEEAQLILSAGDGVRDWESFGAVAQLLGAAVGASKVVCDKGLLARDRQVGSSGRAVAPRVYLAFGISGSTQHLQGIAESASILAVNTDAGAAILRRAQLALITDANALLREMRASLEGSRA